MEVASFKPVEDSTPTPSRTWVVSAAVLTGMTVIGQPSALDSTITSSPLASHGDIEWSPRPSNLVEQTSDPQDNFGSLPSWLEMHATNDWYYELSDTLNKLATHPAGWKGEHSEAANSSATRHAHELLWKLAQEGIDRRPKVGLDHEGTFSLMWLEDDIKTDLTVYDDGTYSFFAKGPNSMSTVDEARVSDPLDSRLLSVLLS